MPHRNQQGRFLNLLISLLLILGLFLSPSGLATVQAAGGPLAADEAAISSPFQPETLSAGYYHTCAIRSDGTLNCWGDNSYDQIALPAGTFTQVGAGDFHTCAIKTDGTLACWGDNSYGETTPPPGAGTFTQVSARYSGTCGIKTDGTLACWGYNSRGQLTPPSGTFIQVSKGGEHTCGMQDRRHAGLLGR